MEKKLFTDKVSVIVPVYNVEKYLDECVHSIICQSYSNLEIILVDDGSSDTSGQKCDKYKEIDNRIKVIHKRNGGLSDARNAGIEIASGEYISFIDSDDYVSKIFIESLVNKVNNTDCKVCALMWQKEFWDGAQNEVNLETNLQKIVYEKKRANDALELMLYQQIPTGAPFKLYHRSVFEKIRFPVGYYYEDVATTYKTFEETSSVVIITGDLYAYRKRKTSIIRQPFSDKKFCALKIYEEITNDKTINEWGLKPAAISRSFAMMFSVFLQVPRENTELKIIIFEKLKECRQAVAMDSSRLMRKKNRYAAWISFLGREFSYFIGKKFGQKGAFN